MANNDYIGELISSARDFVETKKDTIEVNGEESSRRTIHVAAFTYKGLERLNVLGAIDSTSYHRALSEAQNRLNLPKPLPEVYSDFEKLVDGGKFDQDTATTLETVARRTAGALSRPMINDKYISGLISSAEAFAAERQDKIGTNGDIAIAAFTYKGLRQLHDLVVLSDESYQQALSEVQRRLNLPKPLPEVYSDFGKLVDGGKFDQHTATTLETIARRTAGTLSQPGTSQVVATGRETEPLSPERQKALG